MSKPAVRLSDTTQQIQTLQTATATAAESIRPELDRLEKTADSAKMAAVRLGRVARRVRSSQVFVHLTDDGMPPEKK